MFEIACFNIYYCLCAYILLFTNMWIVFVRFYPSVAKALGEKIVKAELDNQVYDEEDAKAWSVEIGNKIREAMTSKDGIIIFMA